MKHIFNFTMALLFLTGLSSFQSRANENKDALSAKNDMKTTTLDAKTATSDSKDSFTVTFSVLSGNGFLNAFANDEYLASGTLVEQGSDIFFEAYTNFGEGIGAWYVNGNLVENFTDYYFVYYNLQADLNVAVAFVEYNFPQIIPDFQFFGIDDMNDVNFEVVWGSETGISRILTYYRNDETSDYVEVELVEGTDYVIEENTLTIKHGFLLSLSSEPFMFYSFSVEFSSGYYSFFTIVTLQSIIPTVTPSNLTYDLSNPGNLHTSILFMGADSIASILSGNNPMTPQSDYFINGNWLFFTNDFLSSNLQNQGDELGITVVFNTMDIAEVSITTVQTGIANATILPNEFYFIEHEMPPYFETTITWNDASAVTGMMVYVNQGWGMEEFEYDGYTVTDLGNGTATLRIYLDGKEKSRLMSQKREESTEITNVLIETSFDQGAPAPIFLTIEHVSYDVVVTVVPEYSGWVSGNWSYSPGENVYLEATPSWGFSFVQWETSDGDVLSTEPFYSFKMPANDVELVARFQESINVYFEVSGNYFGKLYASLNGTPISYGEAVPAGSKVVFNAEPFPGYMVGSWMVNYEVIPENTSNIFVLDNIQSSVSVMVSFAEVPVNHHLLTFNVLGSGGSLTASSGASQLFSGIALLNGSSVTFTAVPDQNMRVKRWKHNGVVVAGNVSNTYVISSLNAGAHVTVEFETITSIDEPMEANLVVYPNPFTDQLFFSTDKEISRVLVVNVMGQTMLEISRPAEKVLDLQNINEGFYFVVFETTGNDRIVHRVVKSGR